jgi:uncharacterized protein YeaO (DUF488 family)
MPVPNQTPCSRIKWKRAYEPPEPSDGTRILVDRLWPRGIKKPDAAIDLWLKDIAPSGELRRWFGHRPERWPEFRLRYLAELQERPELVEEIRKAARDGPVTLIYAARDKARNDAVVLKERLKGAVAEG